MWSNPRVPFSLSSDRAPLAPYTGKPIMVNLAMNIEYWPFDRPMPRGVLPPPHGKPSDPPDVPNFAWVEYGLRCGLPRFIEAVGSRDLPVSALMNAQVADIYPAIADAVLRAEWEFVGHGWFQQSLKQSDDQEADIIKSLDRLRGLSGQAVRAWLGPGIGETLETPDLLKKHGIEFLHDWLLDDLPCWMKTEHGPMVAMPYTFELNDVPIYAVQNSSTDEMFRRLEGTLAIFDRETVTQPKVLTLALHPHLIGVPHLAYQFERCLDLLLARDDVVFMTSSEIGDWFVAADGTGGSGLDG
ncbi:MAG: polysaccharide deacetylase family protein [Alphaproteobacteria bacterium]|nr:polysaccharide deacetylase family protein [Alphaproteobacteria bacterium]